MRNSVTSLYLLTIVATTPSYGLAQIPILPETSVINGGAAQQASAAKSTKDCWSSWLETEHVAEGVNQRATGALFVTKSEFPVRAERGARAWIPARSAAFTQAELSARKALSDYIATEVRSGRGSSIFQGGGDQPPPSIAQTSGQLSNAQKLNTLTGLALDNAIRQLDPTWSSAGLSDEQKRQKAVILQAAVTENIAARTTLFASGAFTAQQCEGPDTEGNYSVLVGLLWSAKLQSIAEAIYNPNSHLPLEPPKTPLGEQFAIRTAAHPDWMAFNQGARVWTDELGQRVVVGFGVAPGSSLSSADHDRARLQALATIQRFVGEKLAAESSRKDDFATQESAGGQVSTFDNSSFNQRIDSVSKAIQLSGIFEAGEWRGKHPWGNTTMQVVALAWTSTAAATARSFGAALQAGEDKARRQGAVPAAPIGGNGSSALPSSAAPVRSGAASSTSGF